MDSGSADAKQRNRNVTRVWATSSEVVMACLSCNNPIESADKFCNGCGRAVAVIDRRGKAKNFLCLRCGTTLKGKKTFCIACGTRTKRTDPEDTLLKRVMRVAASPRIQATVGATLIILVISPLVYRWFVEGWRPKVPVDTVVSSVYMIHTVAGPGDVVNGSGLKRLNGVAVDPDGDLFFVDTTGNRILRLDANGEVRSSVGTGEDGFDGDGGPDYAARLSGPTGIAFDTWGNLYIADSGNHRIRRVDLDGKIKTIAGSGPTGVGNGSFDGDGEVSTLARLNSPSSIQIDSDGNIFFSDTGNGRLRRLAPLRRANDK